MKRLQQAFHLFLLGLMVPLLVLAQNGPGGVGSTNGTSSLKLWLRADSGVTTSGSNVTAWADLSGNSNNASQGTTADQPTFVSNSINGQPAIQFTDDILSGTDILVSDNAATGFAMVKPSSLSTGFNIVWSKWAAGTPNKYKFHFALHNAKVSLYTSPDGTSTSAETVGGSTMTAGNPYVVGFDVNTTTGNQRVFLNGVSAVATTSGITSLASVNQVYAVGGKLGSTTSSNRFAGDIAEVIVYNTTLNIAQRTLVANYLGAKYGIALATGDRYAGDDASKGDYDLDVAGIGEEADGNHTTGNSAGLIITENNSSLGTGEYLIAGHKDATNGVTTADLPSGVSARWQRVWYIDKTGAVDAKLTFDFGDAGIDILPSGSSYVVLYSPSDPYSFTAKGAVPTVSGDQVSFNLTNGNLLDGYYTLGTKDINDSPLPVMLSSFTSFASDGKVVVQWVTESETDNEAFILERGTDVNSFQRIAVIEGRGTTNERTTYSFEDTRVSNGVTYYYRLSDRDYNGNVNRLAIISATPNVTGADLERRDPISSSFQLYSNFPNPFNPETTIRFEVPVLSGGLAQVNLTIYNSLGQKVKTLFNGPLAGGVYETKWNGLSDTGIQQPSGVYFLLLNSGHLTKTHKMVLMR